MTDGPADRTDEPDDAAVDRAVEDASLGVLLRAVVPLIAVSASLAVVYLVLGLASSQEQTLYGVPLLLGGLVCAVVGLRRRLAERRAPGTPTTHGFGLIFLGWTLTVVGLLLPWYLVA